MKTNYLKILQILMISMLSLILICGYLIISNYLQSENVENKIIYETSSGIVTAEEFDNQSLTTNRKESIIIFDYDIPKCNCKTQDFKTLSSAQEQLKRHRQNQSALYKIKNSQILTNLEIDNYDITISDYAPLVSINFDRNSDYKSYINRMERIQNNKIIETIYIAESATPEVQTTIDDIVTYPEYSYAQALKDINLPSEDGTGINVGIYESGYNLDPNNANFSGRSITFKDAGLPVSEHANIVGAISVGNNGIAKNANVYHATAKNFVSDLDWFVSNDVNVVNMSLGYEKLGSYNYVDAIADYYARFSFLTIVKSAGNETYSKKITSPGNGYNVITVGATNVNKELAHFSSFLSDTKTPTLVAPGSGLNNIDNIANNTVKYHSGTSYAAPMVTGGVALMMQKTPSTVFSPEFVQACLMSSAKKLPSDNDTWSNQAGAGLLDVNKSLAASMFGVSFSVKNDSVDNVVATKTMLVTRNSKVKVAVFWMVNSRQKNTSGSIDVSKTLYSVVVMDDNDIKIERGYASGNFVVLEFTVPDGKWIQNLKVLVYQASSKPNNYMDYGAITSSYV